MSALGFVAFCAFGVQLVLVGANQAALASSLGLDLERVGLLGSTLILGIGLGVSLGGPLVDRIPRRPLFVTACVVSGLAALTVSADVGFARALVHAGLLGAGAGVYQTVINAAVVEAHGDGSGRRLAWLHSGATLGAMLAPLAIGWTKIGWAASFHADGWLHLGLAAWGVAVPMPRAGRTRQGAHAAPSRSPGHSIAGPLLLVCLCTFTYVGVESSLALFAVPWSSDVLGLATTRGQAAISAFWMGLLAGRVFSALRGIPQGPAGLATAALLAAVWLALGLVWHGLAPEAWLLGVGLLFGATYPLLIAFAGRVAPHATGSAVGFAAGFGSLGGFAIPWLTGAIGDAAGLAPAFVTLCAWCAVFAAAAARVGREARSPIHTSE